MSNLEPNLEALDETLREGLEEVQSAVDVADRRVREFVSEQPLLALGGALAAGYVLARLMSKR